MSWLQFVSSTIGALAWPVTIIVLAIIFREQLRALAERVEQMDLPGVKLGLRKILERGQESAQQVANEHAKSGEPLSSAQLSEDELRQASDAPNESIEQQYASVNDKLLRLRKEIPDNKLHRNMPEVIKWLKDHGHISASAYQLYQQVKRAHDRALGLPESAVTPRDAIEFSKQAKQLLQSLNQIRFATD